jgi:hypothetical protein
MHVAPPVACSETSDHATIYVRSASIADKNAGTGIRHKSWDLRSIRVETDQLGLRRHEGDLRRVEFVLQQEPPAPFIEKVQEPRALSKNKIHYTEYTRMPVLTIMISPARYGESVNANPKDGIWVIDLIICL